MTGQRSKSVLRSPLVLNWTTIVYTKNICALALWKPLLGHRVKWMLSTKKDWVICFVNGYRFIRVKFISLHTSLKHNHFILHCHHVTKLQYFLTDIQWFKSKQITDTNPQFFVRRGYSVNEWWGFIVRYYFLKNLNCIFLQILGKKYLQKSVNICTY